MTSNTTSSRHSLKTWDWTGGITIIDRNIGEKELILTCHLQEQEAVSGGEIGGASSGDYSGGQWRPPVYELYCH